jgi:hypothetical protein
LLGLLQTGNQTLAAAVTDPENFDYFKACHGLSGLKLPGEAARNKQFREIQKLLAEQPIIQDVPAQQSMDPMTGQPIVTPPTQIELPSVPIEQIMEDHAMEFKACQIWINSEEADQIKIENPPGYRNVVLHGEAHFNAMMAMQQMQAPPPQG